MIRYPVPKITETITIPKKNTQKYNNIKKNKFLDQILSEKFKKTYFNLRKN